MATYASYARFRHSGAISWGVVEGSSLLEIPNPLVSIEPTGHQYPLHQVELVAPCEPSKILAVGRNFKSHLAGRPQPKNPELFYKPLSCLQDPGGPIVLPPDSTDVHFESELVVMVGKRLHRASRAEAEAGIFGVTAGNDVSERNWQSGPEKDVQWWRAKGSDTFGVVGPYLVTGLDYSALLLQGRLNGEQIQHESTKDLIFDVPECLQFISRYVTLLPGDIVYTGTPGSTRRMQPGDVVEVELEGVGILRNPVVAG